MDPNIINAYNDQYSQEGGSWNKNVCLVDNKIETYSGPGSLIKNTENLINQLNLFIKEYNISSIIDVPCGDFNYFKFINLENIDYKGFDVSVNAIERCKDFSKQNIKFDVLDATSQEVPKDDLIICKDLFIHLSFKDIFAVLANIKDKCKYFAVSRYSNGNEENIDKQTGLSARAIEISKNPFNFNKNIIKQIKYTNNPLIQDTIVIYEM